MEAPGQVNEQGQLPAQGSGVRVGGGRTGGRGQGTQRHHAVPDEIQATLIDHVINHHLTMAEWLMYGSYFMCVNKNGYSFIGSMSAMCDVKPWRVLLYFSSFLFHFSTQLSSVS